MSSLIGNKSFRLYIVAVLRFCLCGVQAHQSDKNVGASLIISCLAVKYRIYSRIFVLRINKVPSANAVPETKKV